MKYLRGIGRISNSCIVISPVGLGFTASFRHPSSSPVEHDKADLYTHFP